MLSFIVRAVSGLCIGIPFGCIAYLALSVFALEFAAAGMMLTAALGGLAAFARPEFVISAIVKSIVWTKI